MNLLLRSVHWLSWACGVLAVLCLGAACAVVCEMVLIRYLIGASTIWQTEFVTFSIVATTVMGSPYVLLKGGHVNVDLIPHYLSPRGKHFLSIFSSTIALAACGILAWSSWVYFHEAWTKNWTTESIWAPPLWIPLLPLVVGFSVLTLQYLVNILSFAADRKFDTDTQSTVRK